jgi:antitoxin component of RelBE/YafQ-DinJ toxin-antitoxin module
MHAAEMVREKQLNIRLSDDESRRIDLLTKHYGINTAALVRMLLKRESDALGFDVQTTAKPAKAKPKGTK